MVKLARKEYVIRYPKTAKDLLSIETLPGWVELDLSKIPREELVGTGLQNVKNSGVYIHPSDIQYLKSKSVNLSEVISHSYGNRSGNTLVYRPTGLSTRVLVTVPLVLVKKIWSKRYLSEIDRFLAKLDPSFGQHSYQIYTTGSNGEKGYKIPNSYYGIKEGRSDARITDFELDCVSVVDISDLSCVEKSKSIRLEDDLVFPLFIFLLETSFSTAQDKKIKEDILQSCMKVIDWDLLDCDKSIKSLEDNKDFLEELGKDIFTSTPVIKYYSYHLYFDDIKKISQFLDFFKKDAKLPDQIPSTKVDRNSDIESNIYLFRPSLKNETDESKKKHILSILTKPANQFKVSRAISSWSDKIQFNPDGSIAKLTEIDT